MHDIDPWTMLDKDDITQCADCDDTGWRDVKNPIPGMAHCHCQTGRMLRKEARERDQREWQEIKDAGLWDHPDRQPW